MRSSLAAMAAVALALAGCSSAAPAGSSSGSGTSTGSDTSSGSGSGGTTSGSSTGSTGGIVAGTACSPNDAKQCTDPNHQAWCTGGVWVLRACPGPGGCSGQTCDRKDETPGTPCDALDTGYACDFGYNQLSCDTATHTWKEYCYCGIDGCDDHQGACLNGCQQSTSSSGSGTTSTTTTGTTGTTSSTTTGTTSSTTTSTSGSGGSTGKPNSGEATIDEVGFHSHWAFSWTPVLQDGGKDPTHVNIIAFSFPVVCTDVQSGADAGNLLLYLAVDNLGQPITPGDYSPFDLTGQPLRGVYVFPVDGGDDLVIGGGGFLHFDTFDLDAGVTGNYLFGGTPYRGNPNPSPDAGFSGIFNAPYCQL